MKRREAFRKLRTICQRLDAVDPSITYFQPLKLYLFGSLLTDKPTPNDVDLVLIYDTTTSYQEYTGSSLQILLEEANVRFSQRLSKFKNSIWRGNKTVRLDVITSLDKWDNYAILACGTELRLIWEPDLNWSDVLNETKTSPRTLYEKRVPYTTQEDGQ